MIHTKKRLRLRFTLDLSADLDDGHVQPWLGIPPVCVFRVAIGTPTVVLVGVVPGIAGLGKDPVALYADGTAVALK